MLEAQENRDFIEEEARPRDEYIEHVLAEGTFEINEDKTCLKKNTLLLFQKKITTIFFSSLPPSTVFSICRHNWSSRGLTRFKLPWSW